MKSYPKLPKEIQYLWSASWRWKKHPTGNNFQLPESQTGKQSSQFQTTDKVMTSLTIIDAKLRTNLNYQRSGMTDEIRQQIPATYAAIDIATQAKGFSMPSDILTCSLLRTLAASKPSGRFLELGTGSGLSTSWILDGMDDNSSLTSLDNDESLLAIAENHLGNDPRLNLLHSDGEHWIRNNAGQKFDYIFADTWHGKYLLLDEVLEMLDKGGLYIVDDMLPQENWPEGHQQKAIHFVDYLESRNDLFLIKQRWATGIIVAVKK